MPIAKVKPKNITKSLKLSEAGGNVFAESAEIQGWMYGFAFADLDGHRWNMLFMDFSKLPQ